MVSVWVEPDEAKDAVRAHNRFCEAARKRFIAKNGPIPEGRDYWEAKTEWAAWKKRTKMDRYMRLVYCVSLRKHGFVRSKYGGWRYHVHHGKTIPERIVGRGAVSNQGRFIVLHHELIGAHETFGGIVASGTYTPPRTERNARRLIEAAKALLGFVDG